MISVMIFALSSFIVGTILHILPLWAPELMPYANDEEIQEFKHNCDIGSWFAYAIALFLAAMEILSYIQFSGAGKPPENWKIVDIGGLFAGFSIP